MGKIDLTAGAKKQDLNHHILGGSGENTPEKIAIRMAQLQEKLSKQTQEDEPSTPKDIDFSLGEIVPEAEPQKKPLFGGEIKDPVKQSLIATISAQEAQIISLEDELKKEKDQNTISLEKITELKLKISELEKKIIILEKPNQEPAETSKLRPKSKAAPRIVGTIAKTPTTTPQIIGTDNSGTKMATAMGVPAISRLPKRNTAPEERATNETEMISEDFLHPSKTKDALEEAIKTIHDTNEEPKANISDESIEEIIEHEPFLPPDENKTTTEEITTDTSPDIDKTPEETPTTVSLDEKGNTIEITNTQEKKIARLARVTDTVNSISEKWFGQEAANAALFANSATGKKAA